MLNSIGTSPLVRTATQSTAGLENQLERYRQQLSDCVNCAVTSKTPQGQETARALSDKISQLRARIEQAAAISGDAQPVNASQGISAGEKIDPARAVSPPAGALGNYLNVYA